MTGIDDLRSTGITSTEAVARIRMALGANPVDELVAFVRRCLDEDERLARQAFADHNDAGPNWHEQWSGALNIGDAEDLVITNDSQVSRFMEAFDPARVLAEVEAKRHILDLADDATGLDMSVDMDRRVGIRNETVEPYLGDQLVRLLAQPYAEREGWREEWRSVAA